MAFIDHLILGFSVALSVENLFYALIGCLLGTLVGVLPGLGPVPTIAMLLPITYSMSPTAALIMLSGLYYGAQYGGSTTAILANIPGEPSSTVTLIDGHAMARRGQGGKALAAAAIGSFVAGVVGTLVLAAVAAPLARIALQFGAVEYIALVIMGFAGVMAFSKGKILESVGILIVGVLFGLVGSDVNTGQLRFTFGIESIYDGLSFSVIAVGVFGIAEVIGNLSRPADARRQVSVVGSLWPSREEWRRMTAPILRGSAVGAILGPLPGVGTTIASFISYQIERQVSPRAKELGTGAIEGVAAPEAANNAAAQTNFIPLLTLGIPSGSLTALLLAAMMIHGIQPGPSVMTRHPDVFWGLVASMFIGNLMLIVLNLPLIGIWIRFLAMPYLWLFPAIVAFCAIGVYSLQTTPFDLALLAFFSVFGVVIMRLGISPMPLILGFVLGPLLEENFRRALMLSRGDPIIFVQRPIALGIFAATALLILLFSFLGLRRRVESDEAA